MAHVTGTADDYLDLLGDLVDFVTGQSATLDSVSAGGTGHAVGDILTLTGGTFTHPVKVEVLTLSGSAVATAQIVEGGAYTVAPGDPVSQGSSTGSGTGASFNLTFANTGWTVLRRTQEAASATVDNAGTGYNVNDVLTLDDEDAVGVGTQSRFTVATLTGGPGTGVATVTLLTAGDYEVPQTVPANITTTVAPSGGTGCRLNVTFQDAATQEQVLILEGNGAGSDSIPVGIRTYNDLAENGFDQVYNWACVGMSGYNAGLLFNNQPLISPGADPVADSGVGGGAFVPLSDDQTPSFSIDYWFFATSRRIVCVMQMQSGSTNHFMACHLGLLNPFGTSAEFPFPLYIAGTTARWNTYHPDSEVRMSGLAECIGNTNLIGGPGWYLRTDSVWQSVENSRADDTGSQTRSTRSEATIFPSGEPADLTDPEDDIVGTAADMDFQDIIPDNGVPGTQQNQMRATPEAGGDLHFVWPCTLMLTVDTFIELEGELDGVFWTAAGNSEISEDRLLDGDDRYLVFQSGNRTEAFSFWCMKQE